MVRSLRGSESNLRNLVGHRVEGNFSPSVRRAGPVGDARGAGARRGGTGDTERDETISCFVPRSSVVMEERPRFKDFRPHSSLPWTLPPPNASPSTSRCSGSTSSGPTGTPPSFRSMGCARRVRVRSVRGRRSNAFPSRDSFRSSARRTAGKTCRSRRPGAWGSVSRGTTGTAAASTGGTGFGSCSRRRSEGVGNGGGGRGSPRPVVPRVDEDCVRNPERLSVTDVQPRRFFTPETLLS